MTSGLNVRSWSDARALIHVAAPVLAAAAVASGWVDDNLATLIVTLVLAVFSPLLATVNTQDGFRRWFYPVAAAVAGVLVYLGWLTDAQWQVWLPVIVVFIGPAVAAANTDTTESVDTPLPPQTPTV